MGFENFMKGNEVAAEAALRAGCRGYFFYPLTPSSEIGEYLVTEMPKRGGTIVQMESEVAVINALHGAGSNGTLAMTGTSGCGASLMMEGLSYIAAAQVPTVIISVMRGGPGLGSLLSTQLDYNQFVKGGGHGGYKMPVYLPGSLQEIADLTFDAFRVAREYRTPVAIIYEGVTGQMMERADLPEAIDPPAPGDWCLTGAKGRASNNMPTGFGEKIGGQLARLKAKWDTMENGLQACEEYHTEDAKVILTAFGMASRICRSAVQMARAEGLPVGMLRPITAWPFPRKVFDKYTGKGIHFLTVEMNYGQMYEDVCLAVNDRARSHFMANVPSEIPREEHVLEEARRILKEGE